MADCFVSLAGSQQDKAEAATNLEKMATLQGLEPNHISQLMQLVLGDNVGSKYTYSRVLAASLNHVTVM